MEFLFVVLKRHLANNVYISVTVDCNNLQWRDLVILSMMELIELHWRSAVN